ncbi:glycosyltransferase family 9 protein [Magnetospirillum sp. UT-4]|uniref:glycosyltransferase family 9 protein n=1 Tax=Magnetospirillum sp. UT-4 TaxID=2681467 RepID=UPI001384009E|nr:glycosyltransferase family 9 protein [Magnetospirillum sp. UT-4]CAA7618852.1 putative Glycosyl transferase, family 9 [Magnetospirillum sp. UT-4]
MSAERILVVKLGALGDFVQAFGPFAAIRGHHAGAEITLLTTRPFAELAAASPWFDHVWIDDKPKPWHFARLAGLRDRLKGGRFTRVYDLQTSDRSSSYFRLMGGGVQWSGIARGCSHPHANPLRDAMHTVDRQAEQLAMAGIEAVPAPDLSWAGADAARFGLPRPYALLCPGGAPHRPAKRWPAERFAALAGWLAARGVAPVLIGTDKERQALGTITAACPRAVDLGGRTSFPDILGLGRGALAAVGNDTGPMHLIAASGCPSVVLFSHESDPTLCAPRGLVRVLRVPSLDGLESAAVEAAIAELTG